MAELMIPPSVAAILPAVVRNNLAGLPASRQEEFMEEYSRRAKGAAPAYILWLLLGFHYVYLRRWGLQFLFWITGGGFLIWWVVDLFRVPGMVRNYNKDTATDVMRTIRAIGD
ncbi:MAG: TM2 domain-containing protein [Longimicrobiales bacterium]|nr:TM2 domain-containing protein [Longimicrobiales bacterium]